MVAGEEGLVRGKEGLVWVGRGMGGRERERNSKGQ